jgi:glycerophosphoryl diester phosphodiesterase
MATSEGGQALVRPLLLGHRGDRTNSDIAENSFAAFDLALKNGCDGFEFDVRLTLDGKAVICHDPRFRGHSISLTKITALPELPTLEAVLERYSESAFLNIELKVAGLEEQCLQLLKRHPPAKGYIISSFLPAVVSALRDLDVDTPLGIICGNRTQLGRWPNLLTQFVMVEKSLVTLALVKKLHEAEKNVFVWTVNQPRTITRLTDYGVDGIISDGTAALVATLGSKPKSSPC